MAASDKTLGELHQAVAVALQEQVVGYVDTSEDGKEVTIRPSPALLGAAIAFLKNNNITADPEENAALKDLGQALAARRKRKIPAAALDEAAEHFATMNGVIQ